MSEEEKEAIKCLEVDMLDNKQIEIILNLIKKQQEEIEYYKKQNENRTKIKTCMTHNLPDNAEIICMIREDFERNFGNDFISKDKIREKIEELSNGTYDAKIILQELLEEK